MNQTADVYEYFATRSTESLAEQYKIRPDEKEENIERIAKKIQSDALSDGVILSREDTLYFVHAVSGDLWESEEERKNLEYEHELAIESEKNDFLEIAAEFTARPKNET